jgi:hypothetical protein
VDLIKSPRFEKSAGPPISTHEVRPEGVSTRDSANQFLILHQYSVLGNSSSAL